MVYHGFFILLYWIEATLKSVGNLDSQETREVVMVSTYMRGAVIPISFSKVFLPPYHRDVDIQYPRFVVL